MNLFPIDTRLKSLGQAIANSLKVNKTITRIDLSSNELRISGENRDFIHKISRRVRWLRLLQGVESVLLAPKLERLL